MLKKFLILAAYLMMGQGFALAIPTQITYQGTLKQNGVPANTPQTMSFQLVSSDGNTPYSQTITKPVPVTNGLFSTQLDFQLLPSITWDSITPYIQVSVNNTQLGREPVTSTVYSLVSSAVTSNAITPTMISTQAFQNAGIGFVPQGMIAMFAASCPSGWTRFSALDNAFPLGDLNYGTKGGSATNTHSHGISLDGSHKHYLISDGPTPYDCNGIQIGGAGPGGGYLFIPSHTTGSCTMNITQNLTDTEPAHNHGGQTGDSTISIMPPYVSVVWCQKN